MLDGQKQTDSQGTLRTCSPISSKNKRRNIIFFSTCKIANTQTVFFFAEKTSFAPTGTLPGFFLQSLKLLKSGYLLRSRNMSRLITVFDNFSQFNTSIGSLLFAVMNRETLHQEDLQSSKNASLRKRIHAQVSRGY